MKFSDIINYPLSLLGLKIVRQSSLRKLRHIQSSLNNTDIERDVEFMELYKKVNNYTMVEIERCYALYTSVKYILKNNIPGDFVECGVWKGGSSMLVALLLKKENIADRKIYLYDTFAGMTEPGDHDGEEEKLEWKMNKKDDGSSNWCFATYEEASANMEGTGYSPVNIKLIKGKVEDTIPETIPAKIALLRLDTDWYESTKHELIHLFPLLEKFGVLIIDDYGAWQGARKAVDEYFNENGPAFLNRIDFTGRLLIK